jgi:translation initiation factor 1
MSKKDGIKLSWEEFILKGNPEIGIVSDIQKDNQKYNSPIKVHYEKKGRGGKEALIIRGFIPEEKHDLDKLSKLIKSKLGVGGSVKDNEIIIQGNQRDKAIDILKEYGFKDIKKAGG